MYKTTIMLIFYIFTFIFVNSSESSDFDSDDDASNEQLRNAFHQISLQSLTGPTTVDARDLKDIGSETRFEKVHDDVYCSDKPPLATNSVANMRECKQQCWEDINCRYMAFWVKAKKCQTYQMCYSQETDGKNRISVYKRVSPCEEKLKGYTIQIADAFEQDVIRPMYIPFEWEKNEVPKSDYTSEQQPNFHCSCTGIVWMTCGLFVSRTSTEFPILNARFDPDPGGESSMRPFQAVQNKIHKYGGEPKYIEYYHSWMHPRVTAELHPAEYVLHESFTLPGCVHLEQCIKGTPGGVCPVQKTPFQSGEPVYILKRDVYYGQGVDRKVMCISVPGLRSHIVNGEPTGMFRDPLERVNLIRADSEDAAVLVRKRMLTIDEDYGMFFMFDDRALATGICGSTPPLAPPDISEPPPPDNVMPSKSPTRFILTADRMLRKQKRAKKKGVPASFTEPSLPVSPAPPPPSEGGEAGPSGAATTDEGEEKSAKKNRRGGKSKARKKERSSASSEASSPIRNEPGSLPLLQEEGSQEDPPPLPRTVSDTALVAMGPVVSSPDSGNEPGPSSPFSFSDVDLPSSPKQKMVLSRREVDQLRRSFEAAKARRAAEKSKKEEHVTANQDVFGLQSWAFLFFTLILVFTYTCVHVTTQQKNRDQYHRLLQEEI